MLLIERGGGCLKNSAAGEKWIVGQARGFCSSVKAEQCSVCPISAITPHSSQQSRQFTLVTVFSTDSRMCSSFAHRISRTLLSILAGLVLKSQSNSKHIT